MSDAARFARNLDLYGPEGFRRIREARVAVVGLGGVGSHAAVALARSGVGRLLLIDFDVVTVSSLNRSPVATPEDVGRPKAEVLAESLRRSCPDTAYECRQTFSHEESFEELFAPAPTCVVDAIDSLNPKTALLEYCVQRALPAFSSMGASSRRRPGDLRVGDLAATTGCPLAKMVRRRLRRRGIHGGIACVYSIETPAPALEPDLDEPRHERGRVRNRQASQMSLPGMFGYALAALVLERLAEG